MMSNVIPPTPTVSQPFLLLWTLVNIVGLPGLLIPYGIGYFLLTGLALVSDGTIGFGWVLFVFMLMMLSGIVSGGWFGFWQWLVLRKQISSSGKWILTSSIGMAAGTLLSSLIIYAISSDPISEYIDSVDFSILAMLATPGIINGIVIGISQWLVLREWTYRAGWWVVIMPVSFTLGLLIFSSGFILWYLLALFIQISALTERNALQFSDIWNIETLRIFVMSGACVGAISIGLITGVLLNRLLRFYKREEFIRSG